MRYRVSLRVWEVSEVETFEYEESPQIVGLAEDESIYEGYLEEGLTIAFVDGVRRIDYTAYVFDEINQLSYEGIFATLGAGAVLLKLNSLNLLEDSFCEQRIRKVFAINGYVEKSAFGFLDYEVENIEGMDLSLGLLRLLKEEEAKVAMEVSKKKKPDLIVCDGTLNYKLKNAGCVGFVKTIKKLFISKEHVHLLQNLRKGQRSPIIKVHYQTKVEQEEKLEKYTWYVKLSDSEGLGSLARVEMFKEEDFEKVRRTADLTAAVLPTFASSPFQDARSPQNLLPIRMLENTLRRHLGSPGMARKRLQEIFQNA